MHLQLLVPEPKRILEENIEPVYEKEVVISSILVIMKLEKAIAICVVDLD